MNNLNYFLFGFVLCLIILIFVLSDFFNKKRIKEEKRKEIEDEIKKTDAQDLINDSPNNDTISTAIANEQSEFRERVKHRLNKTIHRSRSEPDDSDNS